MFEYYLQYQHIGKPSLKSVGLLAGLELPSQIKGFSFCNGLKVCEDKKLPRKSQSVSTEVLSLGQNSPYVSSYGCGVEDNTWVI